jgi:hypothetical protein
MNDGPALEDDANQLDPAEASVGLVAQAAGHWAREKLYLLENYLPAFVSAWRLLH